MSAFVEVPFVFDEKWVIEGDDWEINEVKVVLMDKTEFVAVIALTEMNISELSEDQIQDLAKPIAKYAVKEGFLEKAEALEIDGKSYDLSDVIYVNLANRGNNTFFYRAEFKIADLLDPTG